MTDRLITCALKFPILLLELNSGLSPNANNSQGQISIDSPTSDRTRELGFGDARFILFVKHTRASSDWIVRSQVARG